MGFIELFFKNRGEITDKDIEQFISQKIEENSELDYKDIRAYQDAKKLSVNISSFANSEGGLLILGISEDEQKDENGKLFSIFPKEITWGEVSLDKESLENKLLTLIKPQINGLTIKPVRNQENKVIFLIDIPKSSQAPHMAFDSKYHKRINFRSSPMEHDEVTNLFRINWTMKEKLVEKIYEPLSSVLEKHAKKLGSYKVPFGNEIEEIMSKTYYKSQMPFDLVDQIDYYVGEIKKLNRKEHFARMAIFEIINRNILKYIGEAYLPSNDEPKIVLKVFSKNGTRIDLEIQTLYELILNDQTFANYLKTTCWTSDYEEVKVVYANSGHRIGVAEFDQKIWVNCMEEAKNCYAIIQFKISSQNLSEDAWYLIEQITKY
jgi:hypothetical protein